jgi:hypothetical protein
MAQYDIKGLVENSGGTLDEVSAIQATAAEIVTGTAQAKLATPKNLKDAEIIPIHVGTSAPSDTSILWLDTN